MANPDEGRAMTNQDEPATAPSPASRDEPVDMLEGSIVRWPVVGKLLPWAFGLGIASAVVWFVTA